MGLPPAAAPPFRPRRTLRARALALLLVQVPSSNHKKNTEDPLDPQYFFMRRMGLEPTRDSSHKILSLARLPVPTPPQGFLKNRAVSIIA